MSRQRSEVPFQCGICMETLCDPVQMTCEGQHLFCFDCMFHYFKVRPLDEINCPNCRHGNGSVILVNKMVQALLEKNDIRLSGSRVGLVTSQVYNRLKPYLARRFPVKMMHSAGSCVILSEQFALFARNYETLLDVESRLPCLPQSRKWHDEYGRLINARRQGNSSMTMLPDIDVRIFENNSSFEEEDSPINPRHFHNMLHTIESDSAAEAMERRTERANVNVSPDASAARVLQTTLDVEGSDVVSEEETEAAHSLAEMRSRMNWGNNG